MICTDANFSEGYLKWAAENKLTLPVQDKLYTVRAVIKHSINRDNSVGLLLEEIHNPVVEIYISDTQSMGIDIEPTFSIKRFTTLLGLPLIQEKEVYEEVG